MTRTNTTFLALAAFALIGTVATSCSKGKKDVTEEDAVELIEGSLQENSAGLDETVKSYSELIVEELAINGICAQNYDTTYNLDYTGINLQANYTVNWGYNLTCNFGVPVSAVLTASSDGTYSTNRMKSDDNSTANLTITGLQPTSAALNFSGNLTRNGSQSIVINSNTRDITSTITLTLTNLVVNKTTYEIESGSGTAVLTADNGDDTFTFNGSITFNGGGSATLVINGNTYTINL